MTRVGGAFSDRTEFSIDVPLDRQQPDRGQAAIHAELGAPFDGTKPTVFIIADAQQFYVRRGEAANLQRALFGDGFNVVAIVGRGFVPAFVQATRADDGSPDWLRAWEVFAADEWVEDIEAVRRAIVGPRGRILLYGQSGGGYLVHQYLARHGQHVERAVTLVAVHPCAIGELGLITDRFWDELGAANPSLRQPLLELLRRQPQERWRIAMTLQRQHFFASHEEMSHARAALVQALVEGRAEDYEHARVAYQVEPVSAFLLSPEGIPIRVRLYEFLAPMNVLDRLSEDAFHPDLENQRTFAEPLLDLEARGLIPRPT
jgi:pimeloyl-ACP methyl ester carboxylesterase